MQIFITYNINPAVSREEYSEWSRQVDQPSASRQPGISLYEIYEVTGAEEGDPFCEIVEVIEAESLEAWQAVDKAPDMKEAVEQFWQMCDPKSVRVLYAEKL